MDMQVTLVAKDEIYEPVPDASNCSRFARHGRELPARDCSVWAIRRAPVDDSTAGSGRVTVSRSAELFRVQLFGAEPLAGSFGFVGGRRT